MISIFGPDFVHFTSHIYLRLTAFIALSNFVTLSNYVEWHRHLQSCHLKPHTWYWLPLFSYPIFSSLQYYLYSSSLWYYPNTSNLYFHTQFFHLYYIICICHLYDRGSSPYFADLSNPDSLLHLPRNGSSRWSKIAYFLFQKDISSSPQKVK